MQRSRRVPDLSEEEREARRRYARSRRAAMLAEGRCMCGQPLKAGRKSCERCLKQRVRTTRDHYERNRAKGLCGCGRDRAPGRKLCEPCLEYWRMYRKTRL